MQAPSNILITEFWFVNVNTAKDELEFKVFPDQYFAAFFIYSKSPYSVRIQENADQGNCEFCGFSHSVGIMY